MGDSGHESWQYPGASYFALETIQTEAREAGLEAEHVPEYRSFFTRYLPSNFHDWIRLRHTRAFSNHVSRPWASLYGSPGRNGQDAAG